MAGIPGLDTGDIGAFEWATGDFFGYRILAAELLFTSRHGKEGGAPDAALPLQLSISRNRTASK